MRKTRYALLLLLCLCACRHPEVELMDFSTFEVISVRKSSVVDRNGNLNPEVMVMEEPNLSDDPDTKVARTSVQTMFQSMLGTIHHKDLLHIAGIFQGHDIDNSPLKQSGKLIIPAEGKIKNLILVSHYTIGANFESPSETFPLEALLAAKGYAMVIADYIGFGITSNRVHPYMHTESTARSVVDMALAVKPYLEHIGRAPESEEVILFGYSQGGSTTLAVMDLLQDEYADEFPIRKVYAGGGPHDLAATYDKAMELNITGIPCAIPMIVQGVDIGENLALEMSDFFKPRLLDHYDEWINSKAFTVHEINKLIDTRDLRDIMTEEGRDKTNPKTAILYQALLANSVLNFQPRAPIFLFHSRDDETVPFINALRAEELFKTYDLRLDFGNYGPHAVACVRFIFTVYKDLP
jgi:pimeloyl-ACP methyl ester carboxylesterase